MKVPPFLLTLRPKSYLNSRDVCQILGIKADALYKRILHEKFPKADVLLGSHTANKVPAQQWYAKTVIAYLRSVD